MAQAHFFRSVLFSCVLVILTFVVSDSWADETARGSIGQRPPLTGANDIGVQNFRTLQKVICDQLFKDSFYTSHKIEAPKNSFLKACNEATNYDQIKRLLSEYSVQCISGCDSKHSSYICGRNVCAEGCVSEEAKGLKVFRVFDLAVSKQSESVRSAKLANILCGEYLRLPPKRMHRYFEPLFKFRERKFDTKDFNEFFELYRKDQLLNGERFRSESITKISYATEPIPGPCESETPKIEEIKPEELSKLLEERFDICKTNCAGIARAEQQRLSDAERATSKSDSLAKKNIDCSKDACERKCAIEKSDAELAKRAIELGLGDAEGL